jgi:hypothetical protein
MFVAYELLGIRLEDGTLYKRVKSLDSLQDIVVQGKVAICSTQWRISKDIQGQNPPL